MDVKNFNTDKNYRVKNRKADAGHMLFGKIPPQAKEAEEAVLGAILLEKGAFDIASGILHYGAFYVEANQKIFRAASDLSAMNQPIDLLTVVEKLKFNGDLEFVGGPYAVTKLTNTVVSSANIESHSRIILQKYLSRELIRIGGEIIGDAYEESTDIFDLLDQCEQNVSELSAVNIKQSYKDIQSIVKKNLQHIEELRQLDDSITGVPTGFEDLDKVTCGWQNTDLIILAARPSVGKTAFALTLAKNAAKSDKKIPVGIFSLEMSDKQLVDRVLAQESKIWMWRLRNGKVDDEHMKQLYEGANRISEAKIFVDDSPGLSIQHFRTKARMMKRKENVGLIIVDYLQLMTVSDLRGNREQEISMISRKLKETAKELNIPIIALSQMSRDVEKHGKDAKREPQLSDLRESGAIEQDADMVMFLWKPTEMEVAGDANLTDVFYSKIAKNRNGSLEKMIGKFTGADQTHHYLKVVDNKTLAPIGDKWKPVKETNKQGYVFPVRNPAESQSPEDDMPF